MHAQAIVLGMNTVHEEAQWIALRLARGRGARENEGMERANYDEGRPQFRVSLLNGFIGIAAIAAALAIQRAYWKPGELNPSIWITWYLLALSLITAMSLLRSLSFRATLWPATIFGWSFFIFILKAGYTSDLSEWVALTATVKRGLCFIGLCILISHFVFSFFQVERRHHC